MIIEATQIMALIPEIKKWKVSSVDINGLFTLTRDDGQTTTVTIANWTTLNIYALRQQLQTACNTFQSGETAPVGSSYDPTVLMFET